MHRTTVNTAGAISSVALLDCLWILCSQALTNLPPATLRRSILGGTVTESAAFVDSSPGKLRRLPPTEHRTLYGSALCSRQSATIRTYVEVLPVGRNCFLMNCQVSIPWVSCVFLAVLMLVLLRYSFGHPGVPTGTGHLSCRSML
jgi:hypothetical protein